MSKISGLDLGRDEFQIPSNRISGKDGAVTIPSKISFNEKSTTSVIREAQAASELFSKRLTKIKNLVSSLGVDEDNDTVMMDKEFVNKLIKLIDQAQNDFDRIINAASA
jgi:hypothetical protein